LNSCRVRVGAAALGCRTELDRGTVNLHLSSRTRPLKRTREESYSGFAVFGPAFGACCQLDPYSRGCSRTRIVRSLSDPRARQFGMTATLEIATPLESIRHIEFRGNHPFRPEKKNAARRRRCFSYFDLVPASATVTTAAVAPATSASRGMAAASTESAGVTTAAPV